MSSDFYVTGGSLRADTPSYVERRADVELLDALLAGDFCYVLTARQMGKSSLMVRTAARLREHGRRAAVLDLTSIGQNLVPEQWYYGLLERLGEQLNLNEDLRLFWDSHPRYGPLQRFLQALRQVALTNLERSDSHLAIFMDEIDTVRSLPFSTDELFAGIRECYNRRSDDSTFRRLTFCLMGVAAPSDLIRDTRMTPFNIGRRIELGDFTHDEASPLARGLRDQDIRGSCASDLLGRILYWTGGHPYLTQRLCLAVAESPSDPVDMLCDSLFLSHRAQERDDNLIFVRERMLRSETDTAALLELYRSVWRGKNVADDDSSPLVSTLRLSGICRPERGRLKVRNRIYHCVFDRAWIRANMPDAEILRQRAAYRRGQLRASVVATAVVAVIVMLALKSFRAERRAERNERSARQALYTANMNLARVAEEQDNLGRVLELLNEVRPRHGEPDMRGWEWRYLWRLCHLDLQTLTGHTERVNSAAFSPNGRLLATASGDRTVRLWDPYTGSLRGVLKGHAAAVGALAFSPDSRSIATASVDGNARVWDTSSNREINNRTCKGGRTSVWCGPAGQILAATVQDPNIVIWDVGSGREMRVLSGRGIDTETIYQFREVVFAPDGKSLAAALHPGGGVREWDVASGRLKRIYPSGVNTDYIAFAPDGSCLASANFDGIIWVWDTANGRERLSFRPRHAGLITKVAFSSDNRWLASGGSDGTVKLWDVHSGRKLLTIRGHTGSARTVAFSPDGDLMATGSSDLTAKLWSPRRYREIQTLHVRGGDVRGVAISADGAKVATACGGESVVQLWDAATGEETHRLSGHNGYLNGVTFSPDGHWVASSGGTHDRTARVWDAAIGRSVHVLRGHHADVWSLAFSPDNKRLATSSGDGTVRCWDAVTGSGVYALKGIDEGGVAFSPDGRYLASSGDVGTVNLLDAGSGRAKWIIPAAKAQVASVAFTRDSRLLVAGSRDNRVSLWDVANGDRAPRLSRILNLRSGQLGCMALSPDGTRIATVGRGDDTLELWDTRNGREAFSLRCRGVVAFSPDGTLLATSAAVENMARAGSGVREVILRYAPPLDQIDANERSGNARWRWNFGFAPKPAGPSSLITNLDRAIRTVPSDGSLYAVRAQAYAESGQWASAAADWSKAVKLGGDHLDKLTLAKLAAGDGTGLHAIAARLHKAVISSTDPGAAARLARYALLVPNGLTDPTSLTPVIQRIPEANVSEVWRIGTLGLAQFRAGRYRETALQLQDWVAVDPAEYERAHGDGCQVVVNWLLLSMARHRLGHNAEARKLLDRAERWIDAAGNTDSVFGAVDAIPWRGQAELAALRREAESVINGEAQ